MNVAEKLEAAVKVIERDGWMQLAGTYQTQTARCAGNAIVAIGGIGEREAHYEFARYLGYTGPDTGLYCGTIYRWNDAPGQTKENVIATMRACAAIWRAKQENTDANDTRPQVCIPERSRDEPAGVSGEAVRGDTVSAGD